MIPDLWLSPVLNKETISSGIYFRNSAPERWPLIFHNSSINFTYQKEYSRTSEQCALDELYFILFTKAHFTSLRHVPCFARHHLGFRGWHFNAPRALANKSLLYKSTNAIFVSWYLKLGKH